SSGCEGPRREGAGFRQGYGTVAATREFLIPPRGTDVDGAGMSAPSLDGYVTAPRSEPQNRPGPAPIYVVCSPNRQVGKTLLARLLAEHYLIDARPVAAFDLSDEGPGLADFLPHHVTIPSIGDTRGQVKFFDGLIENGNIPKIIDLSHREF